MYQHYIFGKFIEKKEPLSLKDLDSIFDQTRKAQERIEKLSIDDILVILDKTAELWSDKSYFLRKKALKYMPKIVGFSPKMVELSLDTLAEFLKLKNLKQKIRHELGNRFYLDKWIYNSLAGSYLKAQPGGIILHVLSGNVFIGAVDSLIHGLITKNVNILKLSHQDPVFPILFIKSLQQADPDNKLASSLAVLSFKSGNQLIEAKLKEKCQQIIVWGGERAIKSYRKDLPLNTKLIEYGPRLSFAILTKKGLNAIGLDEAVEKITSDIIMWEQRACSSPQTIYIKKLPENLLKSFLEKLARELEKISKIIPQGEISLDEQAEITKFRELARADSIDKNSKLFCSKDNTSWTLVYEPDIEFRTTPLNRFIYIKSFSNFQQLFPEIKKISDYLQTVGLLTDVNEFKQLSDSLVKIGIDRITQIGEMHKGKPATPHEGSYQLTKLIKWVNIESFPERFDLLTKHYDDLVRKKALFKKIKNLFNYVNLHSKFYRRLYKGKKLTSLKDITKLPLIDKNHLYKNTPPQGDTLLTGPLETAYVFSSGGTTGKPKFSFYNYYEFEEVTNILAHIYQVAGLNKNDEVANLFMAGNLWTSFLAANSALEKVGCVSLPIAGNADIDLIMRFLKLFKPNCMIGLPSVIIQIAQHIEHYKIPNLKIRKILYGGEHLSQEAVSFLKKVLGAKLIFSAGYASVDVGPIGYQCSKQKGGVHHLLSDYIYLEIIDPGKLSPVKPGQVGEIVVTNLSRKLMPLIRYRTGDSGRLIDGKCSCGRKSPLFELLGRCDDIIRVGSVSLYPDEFESIFSRFKELSHLFCLTAKKAGAKDVLVLRIELRGKLIKDKDKLAQKVKKVILKQNKELDEAYKKGWLGDFKVDLLPSGKLPRVPRTGKIKKVIDERI